MIQISSGNASEVQFLCLYSIKCISDHFKFYPHTLLNCVFPVFFHCQTSANINVIVVHTRQYVSYESCAIFTKAHWWNKLCKFMFDSYIHSYVTKLAEYIHQYHNHKSMFCVPINEANLPYRSEFIARPYSFTSNILIMFTPVAPFTNVVNFNPSMDK